MQFVRLDDQTALIIFGGPSNNCDLTYWAQKPLLLILLRHLVQNLVIFKTVGTAWAKIQYPFL